MLKMRLSCISQGAIAQSKEPRVDSKSKHIRRKFHIIREIFHQKDVNICEIRTDDTVIDSLTKPLPQPKHESHNRALGLKHMREWL